MASGHVNRVNRPNTWLLRPSLQSEDSSCQPGAVHTLPTAKSGLVVGKSLILIPPVEQYQYVCAEPPKADIAERHSDVRFVPCVDGSGLARRIFA